MPPKPPVNRRKDTQNKRNTSNRADSLNDSDSDDLPPSQKEGRPRLALLVIGPNNNLVKLFQDTSSSTSKESKFTPETPVKKNKKGSRANKKLEFSPLDAPTTPKSHPDEVMDRALDQLNRSPLNPMKYFENETKPKQTKGRKKNSQANAKAVSTKTSFSPERKPLNGKTKSKVPTKLPTNKNSVLDSKADLSSDTSTTVKRGRGRPKGSTNKTKGSIVEPKGSIKKTKGKTKQEESLPESQASAVEPKASVATKTRARRAGESPQKKKKVRILDLASQFFSDDENEGASIKAEPLQEFDTQDNSQTNEPHQRSEENLIKSDKTLLKATQSDTSLDSFSTSEIKEGKGSLKTKDSRLKIERSLESAILFPSGPEGSTSSRSKRANNRSSMVEANGPVVKRTSYPDRGKRLLAVSNGTPAELTPNTEEGEYNRWLDDNLSDVQKMRQLLIWCLAKNINQESAEEDEEEKSILEMAREVEQEVLQDLVDGTLIVDWNDPNDEDLEDATMDGIEIMKPNSTNEANKESIEVFNQKLKELKVEEAQWIRAYKNALRPLESLTIDADNVNQQELQEYLRKKDPSGKLSKEIIDHEMEEKLQLSLAEAKKSVKKDLPTNTDKLFHLLHKLKQSITLTSKLDQNRLTSRVTKLARNFGNRKVLGPATKNISERDLLRGISRVETSSKVH